MIAAPTPRSNPSRRFLLPILWLLGSLVPLIGPAAALLPMSSVAEEPIHDTYYVVFHLHDVIALPAAFVVFAAVYLGFEGIFRVTPRLWLGLLHLAAMVVAVLCFQGPEVFILLRGMPDRYVDYPTAFAVSNAVSTAGVAIMALSLVLFPTVVAEAIIRRNRSEMT